MARTTHVREHPRRKRSGGTTTVTDHDRTIKESKAVKSQKPRYKPKPKKKMTAEERYERMSEQLSREFDTEIFIIPDGKEAELRESRWAHATKHYKKLPNKKQVRKDVRKIVKYRRMAEELSAELGRSMNITLDLDKETSELYISGGGRQIYAKLPDKKLVRKDAGRIIEELRRSEFRRGGKEHLEIRTKKKTRKPRQSDYNKIAKSLSRKFGRKIVLKTAKIKKTVGYHPETKREVTIDGLDVKADGKDVVRYEFYPTEEYIEWDLENRFELEEDLERLRQKKEEAEDKDIDYVADVKVDVSDTDPNTYEIAMISANGMVRRMNLSVHGLDENEEMEKMLAKVKQRLDAQKKFGKIEIPTVHWTPEAEDLYLRNMEFEKEAYGGTHVRTTAVANKAEFIAGDSEKIQGFLEEEKKRSKVLTKYRKDLKSPGSFEKDMLKEEVKALKKEGKHEEARILKEAIEA